MTRWPKYGTRPGGAVPASSKLDPVIGRDDEIRNVIRILCAGRAKNNPVLIGEPGVGKTAIAEGLAQRIVQRRCARQPEGQDNLFAWTWAPWWPAPSTGASLRSV